MNRTPDPPAVAATAAAAPAPARKVGVGTHYLRYSTASILVMLAGLISFPLLTRLLDNTQYGILGYYETWLMIGVAVAKLGAQHAILRFYPYQDEARGLPAFAANMFLLPLAVSGAIWAAAVVVFACLDWFGGVSFSPVLWMAVLMVPLQVFASLVQMLLRAGEHSGVLTITRVAWRWLELVLMVGAVVALERTALAAYGGRMLAAVLVLAYYVHWIRRNLTFAREWDWSQMRLTLRYGMPLVVNEIATVLLISIGRLMLKGITGEFSAVGVFTIGYSLALQVNMLMSTALSESFVPVANRNWETGGAGAVRALKEKILLPLTYGAVGIAAAIACVGSEAVQAISGPDKAGSGPVFAWIGAMYALYPLLEIGGYGLLLHKRSGTVLRVTLVAIAINVALNFLLIPRFGYMGATWGSVCGFAVLGAVLYALCPRELRLVPDRRALVVSLGAAAAFVLAVEGGGLFGLASPWARLFVAGGLWLLLYVLPVLVLDGRMRQLVPGAWKGRAAP